MAKWNASKEDKEAAAGALLVLGGMLYEWGLPLDRAIEGLKHAYDLENVKQMKACTCHNKRDRDLCQHKDHCAEVFAFALGNSSSTRASK